MPPSLTTNGTTTTRTSGALKPGAKTKMFMDPPAMARPLPKALLTGTAMDNKPVSTADMDNLRATVARLLRAGRLPLPTMVPPRVATTTMPGPNKPTAVTTTPDGASLMTPSMPSPTTVNGTLNQ